jgi:hypothetical protein
MAINDKAADATTREYSRDEIESQISMYDMKSEAPLYTGQCMAQMLRQLLTENEALKSERFLNLDTIKCQTAWLEQREAWLSHLMFNASISPIHEAMLALFKAARACAPAGGGEGD